MENHIHWPLWVFLAAIVALAGYTLHRLGELRGDLEDEKSKLDQTRVDIGIEIRKLHANQGKDSQRVFALAAKMGYELEPGFHSPESWVPKKEKKDAED